MEISASLVKELREKTGAGMMDCKKALTESSGDFEKAIEILRKKGAAVAAKRAERSANEGIVKIQILNGGKKAVVLEVNCETDFVAKSDDFLAFADLAMNAIVTSNPANVEELLNVTYNGKNVRDELSSIVGKIGEKIEVSRFKVVEVQNGMLVDYIHHGSKLGVVVKAENTDGVDESKLTTLLKDIAMQTAAMRPTYLTREQVPQDAIDKEKDIYKELARKEGKPENILEKIAEGRLGKFYQEVCLLDQAFVKDNSKSISAVIADFNKENSSAIKLTDFIRYQLTDEKK
jgi:elongation factor Ts